MTVTVSSETGIAVAPIKLPLPPTVNSMFANRRGGGRQRTKKYNDWRQEAYLAAVAQPDTSLNMFSGPVMVDITCRRPRKNCDIDNRIKPVLDLLQAAGVIEDDKHVMEVRARWGDVEGAEVSITHWTEEEVRA